MAASDVKAEIFNVRSVNAEPLKEMKGDKNMLGAKHHERAEVQYNLALCELNPFLLTESRPLHFRLWCVNFTNRIYLYQCPILYRFVPFETILFHFKPYCTILNHIVLF